MLLRLESRSFHQEGPRRSSSKYVVCSLQMHSSMVVTPEGLPLGLASIHFWTRDRFKGCTAMKRKINPTRVPIEEKGSRRCLDGLRRSSALVGRPETASILEIERATSMSYFVRRKKSVLTSWSWCGPALTASP
jgi:hypothetical protein